MNVENKNNENAILVAGVSKTYKLYEKPIDRLKETLGLTRKCLHKDRHALRDVSFTIRKGECVGIIGTNGSGKSTILKIITGVLNPTSGNVNVDGRISALLELGAGFNMEYTGIENIYLNGTMNGFSKAEVDERLQGILDFADIGDYVYQPVKTYSSGMFVRLAFSVAINIEPEILIVDEALSVGDVFFQAKCYRKFEEFKAMGKTIIFVSHDLSSIAKYCDRVILLNQGVKLGEGSPKQMIDDYKRVLVGQYDNSVIDKNEDNTDKIDLVHDEEIIKAVENGGSTGTGKAETVQTLEYGDQAGIIQRIFVTDENGVETTTLLKGARFTVHMKVSFNKDLPNPIFALSIKNAKGTEITGTNTMFEKAFLEPVKSGEAYEVTFTQNMDLQGGEYLLSFGLTGYEGDEFKVYHRLYDALAVNVVSEKNTVGYYDMNSVIKVERTK